MARKASSKPADSTATIGFEAKLWLAADKLRNNMDAAEYKHVVLGLIFLKYISDTFEEHRAKLVAGKGDYAGANPEDQDEYKAENVFWVPADARWSHLQANAKQPTIGKTVDDAMVAIERDNPRLKGVLPKDYARPGLDKHRLGELIDLIGTIGLGDKESRSKDILGRVYEPSEARQTARSAARRVSAANQYFLTQFASAEGKNGGQSSGARKTAAGSPQGERGGVHQFYTPSCVVRLLVEMLAPYTALRGSAFLQSEASPQVVSGAKDNGRIYDPACGSGGMFVQSEKFVESHGGKLGDISVYGQDKWARRQRPFGLVTRARRVRLRGQQPKQSNATTRRLAIMNLANPPFNDSDTALRDSAFLHSGAKMQVVSEAKDNFRKDDDVRWQWSRATWTTEGCPQGERGGAHQFGVPPKGNANFAWVQHFIHHLAPQGMAGFVLANGSMSSNQSGEGDIRRALIEADLVDCMVALPGQLFYSTQIPVCLWFTGKIETGGESRAASELGLALAA